MAKLELGFAIVSNFFTTIDTDDYIDSEEWENMTIEEKSEWIKDHMNLNFKWTQKENLVILLETLNNGKTLIQMKKNFLFKG